jgi:hypothetical protein
MPGPTAPPDSDAPEGGSEPPFDPRLRTAIRSVAVVGVALTAGALVVFGPGTAASVAAGAGLATGNLWALARIISALLPSTSEGARRQSEEGRGGWAVVAILKMFGLVAVVWLLMRHGVVSPLPMVVGFGALPIGIAIGALVSDRSPPEDPPEP